MMSGHGANLIFFIKKKRLNIQNTRLIPTPLSPKTYHFCLTPTPLKVDVMCVSLLNIYKVTEWMIFIVLNFYRQARKCRNSKFRKKNRITVSQILNKIDVLRNFEKHTRKHLCPSLLLMKLHAPSLQLYWKIESNTGIFLS